MNIIGINSLNHDTSICVFQHGKVIFHKKSLFSTDLTQDLVNEALSFGTPDAISWYENPFLKKTRQLYAGQYCEALSFKNLPKIYLKQFGLSKFPIFYIKHHQSHAAYGIYSGNFDDCGILVIDAIGEWNTVSLWHYKNKKLKSIQVKNYPYSLGLFYSAFTKLIGLIPIKDESKLTSLSYQGDYKKYYYKVKNYLNKNLHRGINDWKINYEDLNEVSNIAASVQKIFEEEIILFAKQVNFYSENLIFTGGCAYNKKVHKELSGMFKNFIVPENPGDSGTSIGAAFYLDNFVNK